MGKLLLLTLSALSLLAQNTLIQYPQGCEFTCPPATEVVATIQPSTGTSTVTVTPVKNGTAVQVIITDSGTGFYGVTTVSSSVLNPPADGTAAYITWGIGNDTVLVAIGSTGPATIGIAIYLMSQGSAQAFMLNTRSGVAENDQSLAQVEALMASQGFIPVSWIGTVASSGLQRN